MTDVDDRTDQFFERYAAALLARDAKAMAGMDAVPSLILFPGNPIPVSDAGQTAACFASTWGQYEGVDAIDRKVVVMGEAPGSVWADVTWSYGGRPRERFCYQLVERSDGYHIAVLTPMDGGTTVTTDDSSTVAHPFDSRNARSRRSPWRRSPGTEAARRSEAPATCDGHRHGWNSRRGQQWTPQRTAPHDWLLRRGWGGAWASRSKWCSTQPTPTRWAGSGPRRCATGPRTTAASSAS